MEMHCECIIAASVLVTRAARHTEPPAVTNQLHAVLVHSHQTDWVHVGENATVESTGSHLAGQHSHELTFTSHQ